MFKILLLFALVGFGAWNWKSGNVAKTAFDAQGKPIVQVFTFDECGKVCADYLAQLKRRRVPFEEINVSTAAANSAGMKTWKQLRTNTFPALLTGREFVVGPNKRALIAALTKNFDDEYLLPIERRYFPKHFDAAGKPGLVLYTASWCPACKTLKNDLRTAGMAYTEVEVDGNSDKSLIREAMEVRGYPTVYVGYDMVAWNDLAAMRAAMKGGAS